jgi:hypothetical protein
VRFRRQELDLVGDDLERVAPDAVLTNPAAAVEAAADVDEPTLGEMLGSDLSEAAPSDDVVELQLVSSVVDDPEGRDGCARWACTGASGPRSSDRSARPG